MVPARFSLLLAGLAVIASATAASLMAQAPSSGAGRGAIEVRVVARGTEVPVPRARLVLARVGGSLEDYRTATADEVGRFTFSDLPAGSYRIHAERHGYLRGESGRRTATGTGAAVALADGQRAQAVLTMIPTGVITGRVLENGAPIANVWVRAWRAVYRDGERSLSMVDYAKSDDLGEYRIFGLAPGSYYIDSLPPDRPRIEGDAYVVSQIPSNANGNRSVIRTPAREALDAGIIDPAAYDARIFVPSFHPGTTDESAAAAVDVGEGVTAAGIDLTVARTAVARVRGRVIDTSGQPADGVSVAVTRRAGQTSTIPSTMAANGTFELPAVPPGRYELLARTTSATQRLYGTTSIDVGPQGLDNVEIRLRAGTSIPVRVAVDGTPPGFPERDAGVLSVQLVRAGGGGTSAQRVTGDGSLLIENVEEGDYQLRIRYRSIIPPTSARYGADDVTDAPVRVRPGSAGQQLEIAVSLRMGTLDATVVDRRGRPVAGMNVALVPERSRRRHSDLFRTAVTDGSGQIHLSDVVPGEYTLLAADVEPGDWQNPDVLSLYENRGERVQVQPDARQNATLRISQ